MNLHRFCFVLLTSLAISCTAEFARAEFERPWQQEVTYRMEITLGGDLRTIIGQVAIEYVNNSPDTLDRMYLKAFPNAIQKNSYADKKQRRQNDYSFAKLKPEQEGSLEIRELPANQTFADFESAHETWTVDNTVITVYLKAPLPPGSIADLAFGFTTILPEPAAMRMGPVQGVMRAAYWYPQVCVYDRVLGWNNQQYLGWGENYGDFGTFDVAITAPEKLVVAATGVCVNETDVLPDTLRAALDISNYLKPRDQWPTFQYDSDKQKMWHYVAENVNDFVFTASANFCIDSDSINGVEVVAYPLKHKASRWTNAVKYGKQSIETFSELFLPYQWPVIRICDAFSGMEYPMLTNCGGGDPNPRFALLLYHEIGHQWFMGMIGSNQTDRPALDEGFTTHAEHIAMEKYLGRDGNYSYYTNWYSKKFAPPLTDRNARGFRPLLMLMNEGYDKPMIFSYDRGEEYYPYRVSAYYKSAAMHYSLRSILGDSAYFDAMRLYCERWVFGHPYEDDFVQAMEDATGLVLEEYFRQWFYYKDRLDYAYGGKKTESSDEGFEHTITIKSPGRFVAPVDVAVIWEQGDTTFYTIPPEGMGYQKPNYRLLPTWQQFRIDIPEYEFHIKSRREITKVVVDPHELLMDIDRLNNESGFLAPIEWRLDNLVYDYVPLDKYALRWRPDVWYDEPNGLLLGMHFRGSYLGVNKRLTFSSMLGTESTLPVIDFELRTRDEVFGINGSAHYRFLRADRRTWFETGYGSRNKELYTRPDFSGFRLSIGYLTPDDEQYSRLDPLPEDLREYVGAQPWDATGVTVATLHTGWVSTFRYGRVMFWTGDRVGVYDEEDRRRGWLESNHRVTLEFTQPERTWLLMRVDRFDVAGEPPSQFLHHLSRLPAFDNFLHAPLFRSPGTIPDDWQDDVYLADYRVRGYQDRVVYVTSAWSGSLELTPPDLLPYRWFGYIPYLGDWLEKMNQQLFVDMSWVTMDEKEQYYPEPIASNETREFGDKAVYYMSAGLSLTLPPVWDGHSMRIDFPVYLNRPLPDEQPWDFRFSIAWLLNLPM